MLNDVFNEITQKPSIKEIENSHKNSQDVLEERLISNYLKHAAKMIDEMGKQNGFHSEILNSVEDLKLLTSSTPNTVHDLFPLVEKSEEILAKYQMTLVITSVSYTHLTLPTILRV